MVIGHMKSGMEQCIGVTAGRFELDMGALQTT